MMTNTSLERVKFLGRPVKPVALGIAFAMFVLALFNILDWGQLEASIAGDLVAAIAGGSAALFMVGWWLQSKRLAQAGFLVAAFVVMVRISYIALMMGLGEITVWLNFGTLIIIAGSYFLEATDEGTQ